MIQPTNSKQFARNVSLLFAVSMIGAVIVAPVVLVATGVVALKDYLTK